MNGKRRLDPSPRQGLRRRSTSTGATAAHRSSIATRSSSCATTGRLPTCSRSIARTGKQLWKTDRPRGIRLLQHAARRASARRATSSSSIPASASKPTIRRPGGPLWHFNEPNQFPIPVAMHHDGVIYLSRGYRSGPYAAIRTGRARRHLQEPRRLARPDRRALHLVARPLRRACSTWPATSASSPASTRRPASASGASGSAASTRRRRLPATARSTCSSESGETIVLRAGRTPQVIAAQQIKGRVLASPAISGGRLFIRTDDEIVAIQS